MTPEQAIYQFFAGFGIPAYASTSVPDGAEFPYITYDLVTGDWWTNQTNITANVWYRGDSEAEPNAKAREIGKKIAAGKVIACDGGGIVLYKGEPWCQSMGDDQDAKIKRRYLNISVEYILGE